MDLINSTIIPFSLMLLFSVMTINTVFVSRNEIRSAILNPRIAFVNNELVSNLDASRKKYSTLDLQ